MSVHTHVCACKNTLGVSVLWEAGPEDLGAASPAPTGRPPGPTELRVKGVPAGWQAGWGGRTGLV